MEQTKALNALEPFLALTKSASSPRAAADLITRATSAPNTFIFAELLATPQIQALSENADYASHLSLLKIFGYGIYTDYKSTPNLPALNEAQTLKLRQLSFLTLAKNPTDLGYTNLMKELGLETARTLDPYNKVVLISSVSPLRDLPPNSIPTLLAALSAWSNRCTSTLADLERQITSIKSEALKRHKEEQEWNAHVDKLTEGKASDNVKSEEGGGRWGLGKRFGGGGAKRNGGMGLGMGDAFDDDDDDYDMDVDDEDLEVEEKKRGTKRGFGTLSFGK